MFIPIYHSARWSALILVIGLAAPVARAQDTTPTDGSEAKSVTDLMRYTEETTLGVAHLDINAIHVTAIYEYVKQMVGEDLPNEAELRQGAMMVDGFLSSLRQAGTNELLVTMSTADLVHATPAVIAPTDNPTMLQNILAMTWMPLQQRFPATMRTNDGIAIFGAEHTVARLGDSIASTRFADLLAEPTLQHQLMISLPVESREDLQLLWPEQMPEESPVQFSPRQMVKDLSWVRIAWSLPPTPEFNATLQAMDVEAAARVSAVIKDALQLGGDATNGILVSADEAVVTVVAPADVIVRAMGNALGIMRGAARRTQRMNNLKQVVLAMHNYYAANNELPGPIMANNGEALHSFRVRILPYMNQVALYQSIDLDRSWNAEANRIATQTAVPTYGETRDGELITTMIRIPVIKGSLWSDPETPKKFLSITDGTSNTIAFVEVPSSAATPWMKPGFWELDEENLIDSFFGDRPGAIVALFDGSVRYISRDIDPKVLRALLTHAGGEVIGGDALN
ncbi:DUF1559 domain-containing protein [Planctomycetaceae bacterium SH139]